MSTEPRHNSSARIFELIESGKIIDGINALREHPLSAELARRLHKTEQNYFSILDSFSRNQDERERVQQYNSVKENLLQIAERLRRHEITKDSSNGGSFASRLRFNRISGYNAISQELNGLEDVASRLALSELASDSYPKDLRNEFELKLNDAFMNLWINQELSSEEADELVSFMLKAHDDENIRIATATLISALTLALLQSYDNAKFEILLKVYARSRDSLSAARALVGLAVVSQKYDSRIQGNNRIERLCMEAAERKNFAKELRSLNAAMLRTYDTERINKKLNDEIIPDLMKLRPELEKRFKNISNTLDMEQLEDNPQWMEMIEKSGIDDKLRDFTEMQMEGADVYMSAFARMKGFSFFNKLSNWFIPFSFETTAVHDVGEMIPNSMLHTALSAPVFCSSDKYSLALSLKHMPQMQRNMMQAQMGNQLAEFDKDKMTSLQGYLETSVEKEIGLYLMDLFRASRLWHDKQDLNGLLQQAWYIPALPLFSSLSGDIDNIRMIGDFYISHYYYKEAENIFKVLVKDNIPDSADAQKLGYALEKQGKYAEALSAYHNAELLTEPDKWLLKRLANCYRMLGKHAEAARYYARVLELEPANLQIELLRGHSLLEAGNLQEALKAYYKVDYLDEKGRGKRPVAWCEFMLGNLEKSNSIYATICSQPDATFSDFLNFGHSLFASGDTHLAYYQYSRAIAMKGNDEFLKTFKEDIEALKNHGISMMQINMMLDLLNRR